MYMEVVGPWCGYGDDCRALLVFFFMVVQEVTLLVVEDGNGCSDGNWERDNFG